MFVVSYSLPMGDLMSMQQSKAKPLSKVCATCGRRFEWRKAWARDWSDVKYCSQRCRRSKPGPVERELEATILRLLATRSADASICPSEVARVVDPDEWQRLMEPVRQAARRLAAAREVEIAQGGRPADPTSARGPIGFVSPAGGEPETASSSHRPIGKKATCRALQ